MKFLVMDTGLPPDRGADPEDIVETLKQTKEFFSKLSESGKMESWYHFADRPGAICVLNVESLEELNQILFSHPASSITKSEVFPLIDAVRGLNIHIERKKQRMDK